MSSESNKHKKAVGIHQRLFYVYIIIQLPECLAKIAGQVRQYCELQQINEQLSTVLRVSSIEETATHMAVRIAAEREIRGACLQVLVPQSNSNNLRH